jgi:hypothetical protein
VAFAAVVGAMSGWEGSKVGNAIHGVTNAHFMPGEGFRGAAFAQAANAATGADLGAVGTGAFCD